MAISIGWYRQQTVTATRCRGLYMPQGPASCSRFSAIVDQTCVRSSACLPSVVLSEPFRTCPLLRWLVTDPRNWTNQLKKELQFEGIEFTYCSCCDGPWQPF